jgi:hypothetical protein
MRPLQEVPVFLFLFPWIKVLHHLQMNKLRRQLMEDTEAGILKFQEICKC